MSEGQRSDVFGTDVPGTLLSSTDGGYVSDTVDSITVWWTRSGLQVFDDANFYLPITGIDLFGNETAITYDDHHLFVVQLQDDAQNVVAAQHDYRVLAPSMVTDPNGNRTAVAFNTRGVVIAMARMGKSGQGEGDTLSDPTSTFTYDPFAWRDALQPVWVRTATRETYGDPQTRWVERISYFDGAGNTLLDAPKRAPKRNDLCKTEGGGGARRALRLPSTRRAGGGGQRELDEGRGRAK